MKYALLFALQRSGTGALGSVLDKHPDLKYLGEIFHPDNLGQEQNYFTFLREQVAQDPEACLPDAQFAMFEGFLAKQAKRFPDKMLVVDVKYRSLHQLDGGWRGLVERPTLLQGAITRKVPILHLTRRNALQSFVSGRLAEANKVWHARDDQKIDARSTVVNIRRLSNYIVNTERETELVEEWTRKYPHLALFDYAEMFDEDGLIAPAIAEKVAATLGCAPFGDCKPVFIKQAPTELREAIENFELVEQALRGTKQHWMVE
jgi:hypothetical protein